MNELFNMALTNISEELTVLSELTTIATALILGSIIAVTYRKTQDEEFYQRSLAVTLFMLPVILSAIILFVGSSIARAFSLAGTLSIIRFRSNPGDAKDIGFIFFDIAAGLACGVGLYGYGALFTAVLCIALLVIEKTNAFRPKSQRRILRITIPENLNFRGAFDDILCRYAKEFSLSKIKTTDLGSLFELVFSLSLADGENEQELINELRTRGGNLTISLSEATA